MKLIHLTVIMIFVVMCYGCGTTQVFPPVVKIHPIETPKPPKNFSVKEPGIPITDDKEWIDVQNLQPKQYWRAYSDGAVVLRPEDWRVVIRTRNNIDKWIADEQSRIKEHNEIVKRESPDLPKIPKRKPWYQFW